MGQPMTSKPEATKDKRLLSSESLEKLRTVLIELFSQGLFHQVGIRDICAQAKVSPKTVYKYFGNKEQLLEACVEQDLQSLTDKIEQALSEVDDMASKFRVQITTVLHFYGQRPEVARMIYLNIPSVYWIGSKSPAHSSHKKILSRVYQEGITSGAIRQDLKGDVVSALYSGGINRVIAHWLYSNDGSALENCSEDCFRFIWSAIKA